MEKPGIDVKKSVVVTLSSDKGLCGGINSTVVKVSRALYKLNAGMFENTTMVPWFSFPELHIRY